MYYGLLSLASKKAAGYGTLTTAWITATGETDLTILGALNTLENDLTTYGLTSKIKALYPFVGGTSTKHSYNFMNTSSYQLTFSGGWTHSSTGALPNGTNAYADTGFQYNTQFSSNDNAHLSYYSRTNASTSAYDMGAALSAAGPYCILILKYSGTSTYYIVNDNGSYAAVADSDSRAFYIASRNSEGITRGFKNGTQVASLTATANSMYPYNIYIGASNLGGSASNFSTKECALASMGDGFSPTQAANFYTAVQAFQTTLSRNV